MKTWEKMLFLFACVCEKIKFKTKRFSYNSDFSLEVDMLKFCFVEKSFMYI